MAGLGMRSSMGRTGVCWDNSMAESFFSALKVERVYRTVYATKSQARSDVIRYIEGFYASRRPSLRSVTGGLTKSTMVINSQPWQRRKIHSFRCPKSPQQPSRARSLISVGEPSCGGRSAPALLEGSSPSAASSVATQYPCLQSPGATLGQAH